MTTYPLIRKRKDPDSSDNFSIDWTNELASGETIASVAWDVPTGIIEDSGASETSTVATIPLSGGTAGESYMVGCKITTSAGRVLERTMEMVIKNL